MRVKMCTSVNCVCGNGDLASRTPASAGKTYFCPVSVKRHGASPDQTCTAHPADGGSPRTLPAAVLVRAAACRATWPQPARVGDCASLCPYENSRSPPIQRCDREHRPSSPSRSPTSRPSAPQPRRGAPSPARAGRPLRDQQREHLRKCASRQYHVPATPRAAPRRNRSMPHTSPASPDGISSPRTCIIIVRGFCRFLDQRMASADTCGALLQEAGSDAEGGVLREEPVCVAAGRRSPRMDRGSHDKKARRAVMFKSCALAGWPSDLQYTVRHLA